MNKQASKHFAVSIALLAMLVSASLSRAQVRLASKFPGKRAASSAAQAANRQMQTPGSPSYTYTLLNYPGQLATYADGINKGAATSKVAIVGGYGTETEGGFLARVSGTKTVTESYKTVDVPHATQSWASVINDLGQIVGVYIDSSGNYHGYEESGGKFTEINVPFAGAFDTLAVSINNSGEIVGDYTAASGEGYGFVLIGGTYTSINYPGATYTSVGDVNNNGNIVGWYNDSSGVSHGFLLSGGTYTAIDFPGATLTEATGINDSGDIVGGYCTTSECAETLEGGQGFVLSGGTFTSIAIPNEFLTAATDINNNGVIVGWYQDAAGVIGSFMATP